jgi:predicted glycosyltransferase
MEIKMKIWVDIANPPQVLFLHPIISELEKRGYQLVITTRKHSETISLANRYGLSHKVIGAHGGGTFLGKGIAIVLRALRAIWYLQRQDISLAVSSSSYSQAIAAKLLNIPLITFNDYEGNPGLYIICRVARKIIVPEVFSKQNLYSYGATEDQLESYKGLKEDIYLSGFVPDPNFLDSVNINKDKILVTMRPASEVSTYHQFENLLFVEALKYIARNENAYIILLSRNAEQRQKYEKLNLSNVIFPNTVLDGPNLVYYSDLIVGAGGTMNREAVVLGSPVYSLFMGKMGSVDRYLIESGKMTWINNSQDIERIKITKKNTLENRYQQTSRILVTEIVDKILEMGT